ncbi:unnamed protein product [Paramecium octaurelia]|uniref:Uncharacterized protein n=1 Tax=Paramecium octaurelia TaxID=43137 RepID=A0A8S1UDX6_PAROT|nr:unnamed protein product [Paramecium octaurelia]
MIEKTCKRMALYICQQAKSQITFITAKYKKPNNQMIIRIDNALRVSESRLHSNRGFELVCTIYGRSE